MAEDTSNLTETEIKAPTDAELAAFAGKLVTWAGQLTPTERTLVLALVARAAVAEPADTHGHLSSLQDAQIAAMMSNNLTFLALQTKVQNVSQATQLLSNIAKTDHETKRNAIRNIRS